MLDFFFDWLVHFLPARVFWGCFALLLLVIAIVVAIAWYNGWF